MSNSPYQQWQAELLDYSVQAVRQPGVIVRLCSFDEATPDNISLESRWGYTFYTESFAELGGTKFHEFIFWLKQLARHKIHGRFHFYCLNKTYAMKSFLAAHSEIDDQSKVLWLDPDMIFNTSWIPTTDLVCTGKVFGQYWWGYDREWWQKNARKNEKGLNPSDDWAIMFPFCMTAGDLRLIIDMYCFYSVDTYRKTRDWKSEMYGLVLAINDAKLECSAIPAFGICNNWPSHISNDDSAPISHYTQAMSNEKGEVIWDKRSYTQCTLARPWLRPPKPEAAATVSDQKTLRMLHEFIDWQESDSNHKSVV